MASPPAAAPQQQLWQEVQLSPSGRPVLESDETELVLQPNCSVFHRGAEVGSGVTATVTTRRLIVVSAGGLKKALALGGVSSCTKRVSSSGGGLFKKAVQATQVVLTVAPGETVEVRTTGAGGQTLADKVAEAVEAAQREQREAQQRAQQRQFSTFTAGVGGLMRREETKMRGVDEALQESFKDVDALMLKVKDLVQLAERIKAAKAKEGAAAAGGQGGEQEFNSLLLQLGIPNPVTKQSAGSLYHVELSKQLSDFVLRLVSSSYSHTCMSMITLTDLFCLFNRARGNLTEMISPDDLHTACSLFEKLDLPVRMHTFSSGVIVVKKKEDDPATVAKEVGALLEANGPLTPMELSRLKKQPISLAKEYFLLAEGLGVVCRDELPFEGLKFYKNMFPSFLADLQEQRKKRQKITTN